MAVKRLVNDTDKDKIKKREKARKDFKDGIQNASNVAQLKKVVKDLAAYVFGEDATIA